MTFVTENYVLEITDNYLPRPFVISAIQEGYTQVYDVLPQCSTRPPVMGKGFRY